MALSDEELIEKLFRLFHLNEGNGLWRCQLCRRGWTEAGMFKTGTQHHEPCKVAELEALLARLSSSPSAPPVVSGDLRKHLDEAFRLVDMLGAARRRRAQNVKDLTADALHEIKEAMLLAYPDSPPRAPETAQEPTA